MGKKLTVAILAGASAVLAAALLQQAASMAGDAPAPEAGFKTKGQKVGYTVGLKVGRNFRRMHCDFDAAAFVRGFSDGYGRKASALADKEMRLLEEPYFRARYEALPANNKKEGQAFLAGNKKKDGVVETKSGLQYTVVKEGKGKRPKPTEMVKVHYTGRLLDGTAFDSSHWRGKAMVIAANRVIPGWVEGLQLMKVGSKYKFFIPGNLAYGARPPRGQNLITPNALLIFDVELLGIE